jgi:hypothetical protein
MSYLMWKVDPLLGNDREIATIQHPLLSNSSTNNGRSKAAAQ